MEYPPVSSLVGVDEMEIHQRPSGAQGFVGIAMIGQDPAERHEVSSSSSSDRKTASVRPVSAKIPSRPLSAKDGSSSGDTKIRPNSALPVKQQHVGEGSGSSRRRVRAIGTGGESDEIGGWETGSPVGRHTVDFDTSFEVTGWTGEGSGNKGSNQKPGHLDVDNAAAHPPSGSRATSAQRASRGATEAHGHGEGGSSRTPSGGAGSRGSVMVNPNEPIPDEQLHWYRRPGCLSVPVKQFACPLDASCFLSQRPTSGDGAIAGQRLSSRPASAGWAAQRWDAKDWLWDADRESKAPMIRWKSSLCTVSPASEVYNRTAYRRFANDHAAGRPPSRETSTVPRSQGKRPMTAAVNSRPPSTGGGRSRSRNRPHTAGARIEGQVPTPGEGSGAGRNRGFMQVDEVDEEVSWGDEAQGAANPSQRMTTSPHHGHLSRKNGGGRKQFQGLFYVGGAEPCELDMEVARFRQSEGGDGGRADEHLLSVHHAMRVLMSGGESQELTRPNSSWRRRLG